MISSKFILTQMVIKSAYRQQRTGEAVVWLACQGAGSCSSSTISLQYWAEETGCAGRVPPCKFLLKGLDWHEAGGREAAAWLPLAADLGQGWRMLWPEWGADSSKSRILLMGLGATGTSVFRRWCFHKMSPNQTLFLERTIKNYKDDIPNSSFVNFQMGGFPGQNGLFGPSFGLR